MVYEERLARNYNEVIQSTNSFNAGLNENPKLATRLSQFRAWYYIPEIDAVGPSKFIGYKDMSVGFYMSHTGSLAQATLPRYKRLDGRETEPRLSMWFRIAELGTSEYECVLQMVEELLDRWGKSPHKRARYCVPIGFKLTGLEQPTATRISDAGGSR